MEDERSVAVIGRAVDEIANEKASQGQDGNHVRAAGVSEAPAMRDELQEGTNAIGEAEETAEEVGEMMVAREAAIPRTKHTVMQRGGDRIIHYWESGNCLSDAKMRENERIIDNNRGHLSHRTTYYLLFFHFYFQIRRTFKQERKGGKGCIARRPSIDSFLQTLSSKHLCFLSTLSSLKERIHTLLRYPEPIIAKSFMPKSTFWAFSSFSG